MTSVDTFMNEEVTRIRAKINYETKYLKMSYCSGFLDGLDEKLQEITYSQKYCSLLQTANQSELAGINKDFYLTGYKDGKKFSTNIISQDLSK